MSSLIDRHPWFPFVLAFALLISAWTSMIVIAVKNRPEEVPLEHLDNVRHSGEEDRAGTN